MSRIKVYGEHPTDVKTRFLRRPHRRDEQAAGLRNPHDRQDNPLDVLLCWFRMDQMSSMPPSTALPHEDPPPQRLIDELAGIRHEAVDRSRRLDRVLARSLVAGVIAAISVWLLANPIDRDANLLSAAMAIGLVTFLIGGMAGRLLMPRPAASCPQCGCDWDRECQNDLDVWLNWQHCPGCGLPLQTHVPRHRQTGDP